jgi:hypothetical protein
MKKRSIYIAVVIFMLISYHNIVYAATNVETITERFSSYENPNITRTITLPEYSEVISVEVDNGRVEYLLVDNILYLYFSNGTGQQEPYEIYEWERGSESENRETFYSSEEAYDFKASIEDDYRNTIWHKYNDVGKLCSNVIADDLVEVAFCYVNVFPSGIYDIVYGTVQYSCNLVTRYETYYYYNVTVKYISNVSPEITEVISPVNNQYLFANSSFIPQIKVKDDNNDDLTCSCYIDDELIQSLKGITNTATPQQISFNSISIDMLEEGGHIIKFIVDDGEYTAEVSINFIVDKSPPVLILNSITSTDTSISISGSATDSIAGLHTIPYCYSAGNQESGWTTVSSYTVYNLSPNTEYTAEFKARDKGLQESKYTRQIYTKAQVPAFNISSTGTGSLRMTYSDNNPAGTEYLVQVQQGGNTYYVNASGNLVTNPVWIVPQGKVTNINNLAPNTGYSIKGKARNAQGVETQYSQAKTGTTLALPPQVVVTRGIYSLKFTWDPVPNALGYDFTADGIETQNYTGTEYTLSNLQSETTHTFRIRAKNAGGTGPWSSTYSVKTLPVPPDPPSNLTVIRNKNSLVFSWSASARADSYEIYMGSAGSSGTNIGNVRTYTATGLTPGTQYTFNVRGVNEGGAGGWSSITTTTKPLEPDVPQNLRAVEVTKTSVKLVWDESSCTEEYLVDVDGIITSTGLETFYLHENLEPASGHTYRVMARNESGDKGWSSPVDATTLPEKPVTPSNIMASADYDKITLTWHMVPYGESYDIEVDDGEATHQVSTTQGRYEHTGLFPGSSFTYRVRAVNISGTSPWSRPIQMSTLPPVQDENTTLVNVTAVVTNTFITISWDDVALDSEYIIEVDGESMDIGTDTVFNHTGLEPNTCHTYRIRLKESSEGDWCAVLSLSTLPNPPDAPEGIQAYAYSNAIELVWNRSEGAESYDIEVDGELVGNINETGYLHEGLEPGTTHTYRVRARNVAGVTAWSTVITKSTTNPTYILDLVGGQEFDLSILAWYVQDFSELEFVITYDIDKVEVVDLCGMTAEKETMSCYVNGANLEIYHAPGGIRIKVKRSIVPGISWSGEINTVVFRAREAGSTEMDLNVE